MKITFDFNNEKDLKRLQKVAELLSKGAFYLKEPRAAEEPKAVKATVEEAKPVTAPKSRAVKVTVMDGETLSLPELRELIIDKISNSKANKKAFIDHLKNELKVDHLDKVDAKDYPSLASFVRELPE